MATVFWDRKRVLWWNSLNMVRPSLQPHTAWLFNVCNGNSEQAKRNVVIRYCPYSWQYSGAHFSCNKKGPTAFWIESIWSPTVQPGLGSLLLSSLSSHEMVDQMIEFWHRQWAADKLSELANSKGLLLRGDWNIGTMLRKLSIWERRLCREKADTYLNFASNTFSIFTVVLVSRRIKKDSPHIIKWLKWLRFENCGLRKDWLQRPTDRFWTLDYIVNWNKYYGLMF